MTTETENVKKISLEELQSKVEEKLKANPGIKTAMLAQTLGVPEVAIVRVLPDGRSKELDDSKMEDIIKDIEQLGLVYCVVRNPAVVSESKGVFGGFSKSGPFLNVAGKNIHLHLMLSEFKFVFAVNVPRTEETPPMYSFQFFQPSGMAAIKVFVIESMQKEAGFEFSESEKKFEELTQKYAK